MTYLAKKELTLKEISDFKKGNASLLNSIDYDKTQLNKIEIKLPDYSSIQGLEAASVKLSSRRRK